MQEKETHVVEWQEEEESGGLDGVLDWLLDA